MCIRDRIATHAANAARRNKRIWDRNVEMAKARVSLDQEKQQALALEPDRLLANETLAGEMCIRDRQRSI